MPHTYYAKAVVKGTSTPQLVEVQASTPTEAKKVIEARLGPIQRYTNSPVAGRKPPSWYR